MHERFGATDPKACTLRFHTQTGGSTLTAQQPMNNVVRVTMQALAAVLGGTQSLHTNGMDEALQLPTEEAVRVALRTQQIIALESGVTDTVDPLAGSHVVEYLTDEIETRAAALIAQIDELGGAVPAIEMGWMQAQIAESSYRSQRDVEEKQRIVVGVNDFTEGSADAAGARFRVDAAVERQQIERVQRWRAERDSARALAMMSRIETAARGSENLLPGMVAAVEAGVTVGEIGRVLRSVFGEYQPPTAF